MGALASSPRVSVRKACSNLTGGAVKLDNDPCVAQATELFSDLLAAEQSHRSDYVMESRGSSRSSPMTCRSSSGSDLPELPSPAHSEPTGATREDPTQATLDPEPRSPKAMVDYVSDSLSFLSDSLFAATEVEHRPSAFSEGPIVETCERRNLQQSNPNQWSVGSH